MYLNKNLVLISIVCFIVSTDTKEVVVRILEFTKIGDQKPKMSKGDYREAHMWSEYLEALQPTHSDITRLD